jgi:hypothetical protein
VKIYKENVFLFQLCIVYMFEYVAQGSAAKVRPKSEYNKGCPELYAGLSLCYQVSSTIIKYHKTVQNQNSMLTQSQNSRIVLKASIT